QALRLWNELDSLARQLDPEGAVPLGTAATAAGVTLSVGYVVWNLRNLYLVGSALLTLPLWRQFHPLAVLDVWDGSGQRLPGFADDEDEEETLRPVLG